jgi:serpin B
MVPITKKTLIVILVFLIPVAIATTFLYPYIPLNPPKANETGWTEEGLKEVANANNEFALKLFSELNKNDEENVFFSPYSIFSAFAIVYEGARSRTAEEIKNVFYFPDYSLLRPNFARIYNEINKDSNEFELRTGNALWLQSDYPFLNEYKSIVEKYYGAKAANLDFKNELENSRQTINSFIEEQTKGKIKDLIPPESLDTSTKAVITSAIYFKGFWKKEFNPKNTREMDFKISPQKIVKVLMMAMEDEKFNYTETEEVQVIELPYKGDKIFMCIILPKNSLKDIEPLTLEKLKEWKSKMKETEFSSIYIPKFEIKKRYFLKRNLMNMGINDAFSWSADFSGMTGKKELFISTVVHQAYVKVDEKGTEAAAATAVGVQPLLKREKKTFKADHPFIFLIEEKNTNTILFIGKIANPTQ